MRVEIHPAARRITWLVIFIGGVAALIAVVYLALNLGIALPFTRTALDAGWLLIFGLLWLVIGLMMLIWLRPTGSAATTMTVDDKTRQLADLDTRLRSLETRLSSLERAVQILKPRGDAANPQRDLDNELGSLSTAIQDVHARLDDLGDANHRLNDLESQLDRLYLTLQDAHRRLDQIEQTQ